MSAPRPRPRVLTSLALAAAALLLPAVAIAGLWTRPGPPLLLGACLSMFAAAKLLTLGEAWCAGAVAAPGRVPGYLLAWPGMDARAFLGRGSAPPRPRAREWGAAAAKTGLGGALVLASADLRAAGPLLSGWVGAVGLVLVFHFGLFHLLSLAWRRVGVVAPPIMDAPLRATSLAEFWGRRWNRAFRDLAHRFVLRPAARRWSAGAGVALVYLASGLVHELVISVPAHAGYGLPTAYFLLQLAGVQAERSALGRRLGLGAGARGWAFTALVAAGPLLGLFHPPFVREVVLPVLDLLTAPLGGSS